MEKTLQLKFKIHLQNSYSLNVFCYRENLYCSQKENSVRCVNLIGEPRNFLEF